MKIGLVLEGGGMRGMFTAAVLDFFLEKNIEVDGISSVSAGALFGVNYLSKQNGRALRYNKRFNHDKNYMGLIPLIKEGNIISTEYAYERVPHELDIFDNETYRQSDIPFYAVATDVNTGKPEYFQITDVFEQMDVLRASGSLPYVSKCVEIDGRKYLDGGIVDSIPFQFLRDRGYDKIIVILTRDLQYRKEPENRLMANIFLKKYPKVLEKMLVRHENYNNSIEALKELEQTGEAFVIRPSLPLNISRMGTNPAEIQAVYDQGRIDAERYYKKLLKWMEK